MATKQSLVDFILEQMSRAEGVSARKMFGEYAIYCGGKIVALVCDDQLFVKATAAGRAFIGRVTEGPPYPGAKPCFVIEGDLLEDSDWLSQLIQLTTNELPQPKAKSPGRQASAAKPRAKTKLKTKVKIKVKTKKRSVPR